MRLIIAFIISVAALAFDLSFFGRDVLFDGRTVGIALFINAFAFVIVALLITDFIKKQKAKTQNSSFPNDVQLKQIINKGGKGCLPDTSCSQKNFIVAKTKRRKSNHCFH